MSSYFKVGDKVYSQVQVHDDWDHASWVEWRRGKIVAVLENGNYLVRLRFKRCPDEVSPQFITARKKPFKV